MTNISQKILLRCWSTNDLNHVLFFKHRNKKFLLKMLIKLNLQKILMQKQSERIGTHNLLRRRSTHDPKSCHHCSGHRHENKSNAKTITLWHKVSETQAHTKTKTNTLSIFLPFASDKHPSFVASGQNKQKMLLLLKLQLEAKMAEV